VGIAHHPLVLVCCGDRAALNSDNIQSVIRLGEANNAMNDQYADFIGH